MRIRIHACITIDGGLGKSAPLTVASKEQLDMSNFRMTFNLPPPSASDVAQYETTATIQGGTPIVDTVPHSPTAPATVTGPFVFAADSVVSLAVVQIDGHGNRGEASDPLVLTINDDVAPGKSGMLSVASKEQID